MSPTEALSSENIRDTEIIKLSYSSIYIQNSSISCFGKRLINAIKSLEINIKETTFTNARVPNLGN